MTETFIPIVQKSPEVSKTEISTRLEGPGRYLVVKIFTQKAWSARFTFMPILGKSHVRGETHELFSQGVALLQHSATKNNKPIELIFQTTFPSLVDFIRNDSKLVWDEPIKHERAGMYVAKKTFRPNTNHEESMPHQETQTMDTNTGMK